MPTRLHGRSADGRGGRSQPTVAYKPGRNLKHHVLRSDVLSGMSAHETRSAETGPPQPSERKQTGPGTAHRSGTSGTADGQLRRLGEALEARCDEVRAQTVARTAESGEVLDAALVKESFERICTISTIAVARWMAGGSPEDGLEAGKEAWQIFGQLAAQRAAPLHEVTKRCLRWRDAADSILRDSAERLGVGKEVLSQARAMLQITLDVTLVKMCEVFESERQRTDVELTRRQEELAFMATHDTLTGLPNRTLIMDRGEQMLVRSRRHHTPVAALSIDIDNLKSVNDSFGRQAGDEILQALTLRLDGVLRGSDALGRVGGDEFMVIAEEVSLATGPELIAERLLQALAEPFTVGDAQVTLSASIGIATGARASVEDLFRDADIAKYRAKWDGKNRYVVFDSDMQDAAQTRLQLEMDLREALRKREFFLVYQPTLDLHDMRPTGMEALIRWRHPKRGIVQPGDFIPLLEESGLVVEVGAWVLQEACRQASIWRRSGHELGIAVNVSGRQLDADDLLEEVRRSVSESGLEPSALTLEITETTLMRNAEDTARRLSAIKELGVRIAIDDFGTGYSSLAHLQRFPVDALKIDRSFTSQLTQNPEGETLMHTLVQLGKALSIETLAEGIEQPQELSLLRHEQCDSGQGFLFARPMEPLAAEAFLEAWPINGARVLHMPQAS
jgi:diguanylate cyclase (GGDEF)-like protein